MVRHLRDSFSHVNLNERNDECGDGRSLSDPQSVEAAWSVLPKTSNTQGVGQLGTPILTKQHDQLAC